MLTLRLAAFGPFILAPLSELYGRVPVLQIANLVFLVFNLVCGFAQTPAQLLVFRFFAGLGGAAPIGIGGGVMGDCFAAEDRGKAVAIYTLGPILGPALGPIAGGFISENISWRWIFWIVSMFTALVQSIGLFYLQETNAAVLLIRKAKRLRKETGNEDLYAKGANEALPLGKKLKVSLSRPFRLLFTQPIVICLALYMAYIYGLMYLVISTFTTLFTDQYHESVGIAGLNYIALALGFTIGAQGTSLFVDKVYKALKKRNNGEGKPEFRIVVMIPGAILTPVGLFWYGWSAQAHTHWIVPDIGICIFAASVLCGNMAIQTYVIDAYTKYAASGIAAISFLRSLAGFGFPLFAPYMYNSLGYGWGNSVLAFIAIALGFPAPWFFWHYGARLRAKSPFAAGE
jgi:multidrug resistance protein